MFNSKNPPNPAGTEAKAKRAAQNGHGANSNSSDENLAVGARGETTAPDSAIAKEVGPAAPLIPRCADPAILEHYRRLRTKVQQARAAEPFGNLLVTSGNPQEGKTITCINLGFSFAMVPGFRVIVVDGDLRRGSLGTWFHADRRVGFSNLLDGSAQLDECVLKYPSPPLHLMPRGNSTQSAGELLLSPNLTKALEMLQERYDLVLIDSPPINLTTDTQLLSATCDAILLVARAFVTTKHTIERAVQELEGRRILGTVLNDGDPAPFYYRNSYKSYYGK